VKSGHHFGETVLTGRRRVATYVAATWCEFLTISRDDLADLFQRRPNESRRFHQAVLQGSVPAERMRRLGSRFLMKMEGLDPRVRAALQIQEAWDRCCTAIAMEQHRRHFLSKNTHRLRNTLSSRALIPPPLPGAAVGGVGPSNAAPSPTKSPLSVYMTATAASQVTDLAPLHADARKLLDTLSGLASGMEALQADARGLIDVLGQVATAQGTPQTQARSERSAGFEA